MMAALLAFLVKRIVNRKFALENLVITQAEFAEAVRDPAQTFTGRMRMGRTGIGRANKLAQ